MILLAAIITAFAIYHLGDEERYEAVRDSIGTREPSVVYSICTGNSEVDYDGRAQGLNQEGLFKDSVKKCLYIVQLSGLYQVYTINMDMFATQTDINYHGQDLELPTILCLKERRDMRLEGQLFAGNHVICLWKGQIIDYESKRSYPLTLDNINYACGENSSYDGISAGFSLAPAPHSFRKDRYPSHLSERLNKGWIKARWTESLLYKTGKENRKRKRR